VKRLNDQQRVTKAYNDWKKFNAVFNKLPMKVRRELGELIEFRNTGEVPPGAAIEGAFKEWLDGGRA